MGRKPFPFCLEDRSRSHMTLFKMMKMAFQRENRMGLGGPRRELPVFGFKRPKKEGVSLYWCPPNVS